jgi:DNA-directed RNA polymerase beta subunit
MSILLAIKSAEAPTQLRSFTDIPALRNAIYDNALSAAQNLEPVANQRYSLHVENVDWGDPGEVSLEREKDAVLKGETLKRRLRGDYVLRDPAGKELSRRKSTLASIPILGNRGTFIIGGNDHALGNQARLRPGIYVLKQANGEINAHVNVLPGKGLSHHYHLEPSTGLFRMQVSQAHLPLLPILRALGATDTELRGAWGDELLAVNQKKGGAQALDKLYAKLFPRGQATDPVERHKAVAKTLTSMAFDPEVNRYTLGKPHATLSKEAILDTTKKLLNVSRGNEPSDDRDHLGNQLIVGPEDMFAERIRRSKLLMHPLLWKATTKGDLSTIPANALEKHVHGALLGSGLGQLVENVNPLDVLDQQTSLSRLGTGGLSSIESAPASAREVHPSQLGYVDLLRTPESTAIGLETRLASGARKGNDGKIYAPYQDARTHKISWLDARRIHDLKVAFPGEWESNAPLVTVRHQGEIDRVPRNEVDLLPGPMEDHFNHLNNLVPFKANAKGHRASMASRFIVQSLPLDQPEAPLVRNEVPGQPGHSYEELYGRLAGAVHAEDKPGRVAAVTPTGITVRYEDGTDKTHELAEHFPHNRKSELHNTPMVEVGDPIHPGQLLAKSNYTDDEGHVALGLNARVAYTAWRGLNHEDAYVISKSFANRLKSTHLYQHFQEHDPNWRMGKNNYQGIFAGKFSRDIMGKMDDDGIIKRGQIVEPNEPLILAAVHRPADEKSVHTGKGSAFVDRSILWDHAHEGLVTDVAKTPKGILVAVKTLEETQEADKTSGRHGDKGVVTILPDDQMPQDPKTGQAYDIASNPQGVITRGNPAQLYEAAMGKLAQKLGHYVTVPDFQSGTDMQEYVQKQLEPHGLSLMEEIEDPVTGQRSTVATGVRHYMKLHHQAFAKHQGRGLGSYTSEGAPAKVGGHEGSSKRFALMNVHAALSHGATSVLRDMKLVRGQANPEYWSAFMSGFLPPTPQVPFVHKKFVESLRASGIDVERRGHQVHLMALTGPSVNEMTGDRLLTNAETVHWKDGMTPVAGGLFDTRLTGSHGGNRWAAIALHEPMPNPVMAEPIRHLLGLTGTNFEKILAGQAELNGKKGPSAIYEALSRINVDKELDYARDAAETSRGQARDLAVRKLGYLKALKKQGMHPREWFWDRVPVLPPLFRPISQIQGGTQLVADPNILYKEVFDANENLKNLSSKLGDVSEERRTLYNAIKAVTGLGDPVREKNRQKHVKGLLQGVFGSRPKWGFVQQRLLGTPVDLVGRAVVIPDPQMDMDSIGLPETRAWAVYSPFVIRRMVKRGVPSVRALEYLKARNPMARQALLEEMNERPVVVSRAPVLFKYGLMAFLPKLVKGDTIRTSPLVNVGYNLDHDGDMMNYEVVATPEAVQEAKDKMLPSRNLLSVSDFKSPVYMPRVEFTGGLFHATSEINKKKKPRVFATVADLSAALHRGEVSYADPVVVADERHRA